MNNYKLHIKNYSTVIVPFISLCPAPHGTEHLKPNVPALSVGSFTDTFCPGATGKFTPRSGMENPCDPTAPTMVKYTSSPTEAVTALGVKLQLSAVIFTVRGMGGCAVMPLPPASSVFGASSSSSIAIMSSSSFD